MLTSPMGICIIVSCSIAGISVERVSRAIWPFLLIMIIDLLIVPFVTIYLPRLFMY
ncbi:MAG: hypothetical protein KKE12_16120 [Proteobacteria bacterium]|nr:hypothetical protein [Pseudomonadota bacterium]